MPRSVGSFRKVGWTVIPFPVDYKTYGPKQLGVGFNMISGISRFGTALRAWSALVVYYFLERTDALFPGPRVAGQPVK